MMKFAASHLRSFCVRSFKQLKLPDADAAIAAEVLISADLRGYNSHGVARLKTYTDMLRAGRINPNPKPRIVRETGSTATYDGDNGLGCVVGHKANELAIKKAKHAGSGYIAVCNSNHFGICGYYTMQTAKHNMIGLCMSGTYPLVTPLWGRERMLGTNPLAMAAPAFEELPVVIDIATSASSFGKIEIANRKKEPIPFGWAVDAEGKVTTDPAKVIAGGAQLPLGSTYELGGHKGTCLAMMVDIMSCVLSGANYGPFSVPFMVSQKMPDKLVGKGQGHMFAALDINGFMDVTEFRKHMDQWIRTLKQTKMAADAPSKSIVIPGHPEAETEKERLVDGIPVLLPVVDNLREIAKDLGIEF